VAVGLRLGAELCQPYTCVPDVVEQRTLLTRMHALLADHNDITSWTIWYGVDDRAVDGWFSSTLHVTSIGFFVWVRQYCR